jgi:hypothetical protein
MFTDSGVGRIDRYGKGEWGNPLQSKEGNTRNFSHLKTIHLLIPLQTHLLLRRTFMYNSELLSTYFSWAFLHINSLPSAQMHFPIKLACS